MTPEELKAVVREVLKEEKVIKVKKEINYKKLFRLKNIWVLIYGLMGSYFGFAAYTVWSIKTIIVSNLWLPVKIILLLLSSASISLTYDAYKSRYSDTWRFSWPRLKKDLLSD